VTALPEQKSLDRITQAAPDAPFVIAQLGQSLDGRIATLTGHSRYINRNAALDHLHRLRAHVDGVLVGIGTVVADDPILNVRRGIKGQNPARIVIDPQGRIPLTSRLLLTDVARTVIITANDNLKIEGVEIVVLKMQDGGFPPQEVVSALFALGLKKILIEGGAYTISRFISAGAVNRLHVMVAPMIIGSGKPGIELPPIAVVDDALRPLTDVYVMRDGDVLFDCDLKTAISGGVDE
jgi:diaminohydroxyphosphoribosylaminopyrimidine deaminase / 5-amino-6-(5-phosphoribosylamino)uracil reductase